MQTNPVKGNLKRHDSPKHIPWIFNWEIQDLIHPVTLRRKQLFAGFIGVCFLFTVSIFVWYNFYSAPGGKELVNKMVIAAGGMNTWHNINQGHFLRTHNFYGENGELIKTKKETFYFKKSPQGLKLMVNAVQDDDEVWVGRGRDGFWAFNKDVSVDPIKSSKELGMMCDSEFCDPLCASTMAFYRFSMPFKLSDPGVNPKNMGSFVLNGEDVNVLEITFDPEVGRDRWVFYADNETNLIRKIEYHHNTDEGNTHPEEIYWTDYQEVGGFTFSHKWVRYHSNGKLLEEYIFSDVDFESEIEDSFFNRHD